MGVETTRPKLQDTTIKAYREARQLAREHHFFPLVPVEFLIGSLINADPNINTECDRLGMTAQTFLNLKPPVGIIPSFFDRPVNIFRSVTREKPCTKINGISPADVLITIFQADPYNYPGIHGALGMSAYRRGITVDQIITTLEKYGCSNNPKAA